jgi:exopolysaccharide biosynthesis polyprenyl glycosylphosphotransferase
MLYRWISLLILCIIEVVLIEILFFVTYLSRFQSGVFQNPISFTAPELLLPSVVVLFYWVFLFAWFGLYRYDPLQSRSEIAVNAFKASAFGVLILFILTFDPNRPLPETRVILLGYGIGIYLIGAGDRIFLSTILGALRVRGIGAASTLLVGNGAAAASLMRHVRLHPELGFAIQGHLGKTAGSQAGFGPFLGEYSRFRQCLKRARYDAVLFALEPNEPTVLQRLVRMLRAFAVRSFVVSEQYQVLVGEVRPARIPGHPLVEVRPELLSPVERALKRILDIVASLLMLILTLPIWILLAILIPLDSHGPVFYSQKRVGFNDREFTLYKFRSMHENAEDVTGAVLAVARDPRVTRLGRLMRATRLDELPQLVNILLGQMSLVGPRPERREFVERFVKEVPLYERRLNVKPGLTGWSQVHLKYDSRADQTTIKLRYDFYYIEHMSLPLDMKILFMTLFVILRGEGL